MKHPFSFLRKKESPTREMSKYRNEKVIYQDISFDSKKEMQRYIFLKEQEQKGIISDLQVHKTYLLIPKQTYHTSELVHLKTKDKIVEKEKCIFLSVHFTPDFVYQYQGQTIAEDVKGSIYVVSKDFPLRQKLLYYIHHIMCYVITKPTAPLPIPLS